MSVDRPIAVASVEDLLAHAFAIETEAEERYLGLADQMDAHNNVMIAGLFRKLAKYEGEHARRLEATMGDRPEETRAPWQFSWTGKDAPESMDPHDLHYLMTPAHALRLALAAEKRAHEFFSRVADQTDDAEIARMAREMAAEEQDHIRLVESHLKDYPEPPEDWDFDPDPAALQE